MKQDVTFIPLGGGQRVGASCYYLRLGEANIILDTGIGMEEGMEFCPDFRCLLTSPWIQSMNQMNQIFISHAHMDHIGCLPELMSQSRYSTVYMTEVTKMLAKYQLYDRAFIGDRICDEDARLAVQGLLEKVAAVSYMQSLDFGRYRATFYPAGHIPGAMMILFECGKRRILYTGDYSLNSTLLTQGCLLPDNLDIDTVIMCGLHAKHPQYTRKSDALYKQVGIILRIVETTGRSVRCRISQLSKGIEFLKAVNVWGGGRVPVYLDSSVMGVIENMERLSVPILAHNNRLMGDRMPDMPHIYLTACDKKEGYEPYRDFRVNFTLHEDFAGMKEFIKKINPRQAVLVHCGRAQSVFDVTIEQEMMLDGECRTQFIFAEEKEIYEL